jgi:hypothetical protein
MRSSEHGFCGRKPGELSQFGRDLEEPLGNSWWMMSIQALGDGVELPDYRFPAQASSTRGSVNLTV